MKLTASLVLFGLVAVFHTVDAALAAIGTPVANAQLPTLDGGKETVLGDVDANVLIFFRPGQERSQSALRQLARCQKDFAGKSTRWVAVVPGSAPKPEAAALMRDSGLVAPVLVDNDDALYGSLGLDLHPVVAVIGRDHKLASFEPFRALDYCPVISARIRHAMHEITDTELRAVLDPPKVTQGGNDVVARRYRAYAEKLLLDKQYDKALANAHKSLDKDPTSAAAHTLLGQVLRSLGKCADAVAAFKQALTLDGTDVSAKEGLQACEAAR